MTIRPTGACSPAGGASVAIRRRPPNTSGNCRTVKFRIRIPLLVFPAARITLRFCYRQPLLAAYSTKLSSSAVFQGHAHASVPGAGSFRLDVIEPTPGHFAIVELQLRRADNLMVFVSFAGN